MVAANEDEGILGNVDDFGFSAAAKTLPKVYSGIVQIALEMQLKYVSGGGKKASAFVCKSLNFHKRQRCPNTKTGGITHPMVLGHLFIVEITKIYIIKKMCKSEIFNQILNVVEKETEIERADILSANKNAEVVDARYMLVYLLYKKGLYYREIARMTGISRQAVGRMISLFDRRRFRGGKIFEITLNKVCNMLEIN